MTKQEKILYGAIGVVVIIVIILVINIFRGNKPVNDHAEVIKAKDETIKAIQSERDAWKQTSIEVGKRIDDLEKRDSLLALHFNTNQSTYKKLNEKINSIPALIGRIAGNDDSIRAAFSRYSAGMDSP